MTFDSDKLNEFVKEARGRGYPDKMIQEFVRNNRDRFKTVERPAVFGNLPRERPFKEPRGATGSFAPGFADTAATVGKEALRAGGAIGGALLGAPVLPPVGVIAGAGAGEASAEALIIAAEDLFGSTDAPQTPGQVAARGGIAFARGAGAEFGGRVVFKIAGKTINLLGAPFRKQLLPKAQSLLDNAKQFGVKLLPSRVTKSSILKATEEFIEGSVAARKGLELVHESNEIAIEKGAATLARKFSKGAARLSDAEYGTLLADFVQSGVDAAKVVSNTKYAALDEIAGKRIVVPDEIVKLAQDKLAKTINIGRVGAGETGGTVARSLATVGRRVTPEGKEVFENITFSEGQELRSVLLDLLRSEQGKIGGSGKKIGFLKRSVSTVDNAMEQALIGEGPELNRAFREANAFFKEAIETLQPKFLKRVLLSGNVTPERIGETVFRMGNVEEIKMLKVALKKASALDESLDFADTWNRGKLVYIENLLETATNNTEGILRGAQLLKPFHNPRHLRTMKAVFTEQELVLLRNFAEVVDAQQKALGGPGRLAAQIIQAGVPLALLAGPRAAAGALAVATIPPVVLAKMLLSPRTQKLLTVGLKTPQVSAKAGGISAQITKAIARTTAELGPDFVERSRQRQTRKNAPQDSPDSTLPEETAQPEANLFDVVKSKEFKALRPEEQKAIVRDSFERLRNRKPIIE